ncbi:TatD family hydrolase [Bacteroides helcogenes]|uniref:TatD-related deoxyribonuclease n=1 Tax=Bacteroides helcogenes (strain ATCC 35417 / DSM 20613 / JCM 6297 / CCUG 15421 / P 36-108) TaxID=693979 RepID=E6SNW7_BACT6|nr:TatD family hydrolase [Bacteroides helcogenes]ADV42785.1 TatD-related deoxyribonuclease [Bacteroides helcogenes P 36-108]MDY5239617.1 TatD family hydrolase [Bacteroides helcogenes]
MKLPVDIHTHRLPQLSGEAIVNCCPEAFVPQEGGWYSVGIHPWRVASSDIKDGVMDNLSRLLCHPQVLAMGEAGLDKLADAPMSVQTEIFRLQACLAMEVGKPLIIHLVKAVEELLRIKRELYPSNPWIIHGFRGKEPLAAEYLRHGFYLSFGEKYREDTLRRVPSDRLFIETDESMVPVEELYERAAAIRGVSSDELKETIKGNISRVFFKR